MSRHDHPSTCGCPRCWCAGCGASLRVLNYEQALGHRCPPEAATRRPLFGIQVLLSPDVPAGELLAVGADAFDPEPGADPRDWLTRRTARVVGLPVAR